MTTRFRCAFETPFHRHPLPLRRRLPRRLLPLRPLVWVSSPSAALLETSAIFRKEIPAWISQPKSDALEQISVWKMSTIIMNPLRIDNDRRIINERMSTLIMFR